MHLLLLAFLALGTIFFGIGVWNSLSWSTQVFAVQMSLYGVYLLIIGTVLAAVLVGIFWVAEGPARAAAAREQLGIYDSCQDTSERLCEKTLNRLVAEQPTR